MRGAGLPVYRGYSSQYGAGLGNILGGLLRAAVPLFAPMVKSGAHRLLDHGLNTLTTRITGQAPAPPRKNPRPRKRPVKRTLPVTKRSLPGKRARRRNLSKTPRDALS